MNRYVILLALVMLSTPAWAQSDSALETYRRCYSQITSLDIDTSSQVYTQVRNGSVDPIDACLAVLELTALKNNNGRLVTDSAEARGVLRTFHQLHFSWIKEKAFFADNAQQVRMLYNLYDTSAPAMHFTAALLRQDGRADQIVKGNRSFAAIRQTVNAADPYPMPDFTPEQSAFANIEYVPTGHLLGIKQRVAQVIDWDYRDNQNRLQSGSFVLADHHGGGLIGDPAYLQAAIKTYDNEPDGGTKMPRLWARNLFSDVLCRDLPAVRFADAAAYYQRSSSVPFRADQSCAICHASMDQAAAAMRHLKFEGVGRGAANPKNNIYDLGTRVVGYHSPSKPAAAELWPFEPDTDFYRRPTDAKLYFRSFDGRLVNVNVSSAADLGAKIAAEQDMYVCLAKRYYEYFTGISANIDDAGMIALSSEEWDHRRTVIEMGVNLKNDPSQSVKGLIKAVLNSNQYRNGAP